jgi:hypothetical protein
MTDGKHEIRVKKFDIDRICKKPFCAIVVGKRGSGKSYLTKDIMYQLHRNGMPRCCVFSATEGANSFFQNFVPGIFVHSPFQIESLTHVWNKQKDIVLRQKLGQIDEDVDTRLLILLDDCAFEKKLLASQIIREMFLNGRHYNLTLIITLQYLIDLCPAMRANCDVGFFLKENIKSNRVRMYTHFAGFYPDYKMFEAVFESCTNNYECFIVDNTVNSTRHEDIVSYYKGGDADFKFGPPSLWNYHNKVYLSYEDEYVFRQHKDKLKLGNSVTKVSGNSVITVVRQG